MGEERWLRQIFKGKIFHAFSQSRSRGVMVGEAADIPWGLTDKILDKEGRYVIIKGRLGPQEVTIVGIYAPHTQQTLFWIEVLELFR